jgi:ATP-dependent exoDNAse (exonuclease V) alpha subunit
LKQIGTPDIVPVVVIDECSIIDSKLYKYIAAYRDRGVKIIYLGDSNQLPPINDSFSIFNRGIYTLKLTKIMRTINNYNVLNQLRNAIESKGSRVQLNTGGTIQLLNKEDILYKSVELAMENPVDNKVLCYTNNNVTNFNSYIRKNLQAHSIITGNELGEFPSIGEYVVTTSVVQLGKSSVYLPSDTVGKVESVSDSKFVYHGLSLDIQLVTLSVSIGASKDLSVVLQAYSDYNTYKALKSSMFEEKDYTAISTLEDTLTQLRPIYSQTVHKSQGSTYNSVLIDLTDLNKVKAHNMYNRLLYVAVSRATDNIYIYNS